MESVIHDAQTKCREALTLRDSLINQWRKDTLKLAIDNVYRAIAEDNIPKVLRTVAVLEKEVEK